METGYDEARSVAFRELHDGQILVLPGVWDVASARVFAAEGFPALGTTSAGIAWTLGQAVGQDAPWPLFLNACRQIASAVAVPVSFDVEAGFGDSAELIRDHVQQAIEAGACGINLEDGLVAGKLRDPRLLEEAIQAIREMCVHIGCSLFLNARTDVYLGGVTDESKQLGEAVRRGRLYAEAGADGFFVPGIVQTDAIESVVSEVPVPLNVYALPGLPAAARLQQLGVRRVSVGCGPLQSVLARTRAIARDLRSSADWGSFTDDWLDYDVSVALCSR